jgi:hypothetical protein
LKKPKQAERKGRKGSAGERGGEIQKGEQKNEETEGKE